MFWCGIYQTKEKTKKNKIHYCELKDKADTVVLIHNVSILLHSTMARILSHCQNNFIPSVFAFPPLPQRIRDELITKSLVYLKQCTSKFYLFTAFFILTPVSDRAGGSHMSQMFSQWQRKYFIINTLLQAADLANFWRGWKFSERMAWPTFVT